MEPLLHFIAPLVALSLLGVRFKEALPLALLALLPDFDALLLVHRSLTHSLAILLAISLPILAILYLYRPRLLRPSLLALLSISSHLALDLFDGYTPLFWPLYDQSLWLRADLMAHIGSPPTLFISAQLLTRPVSFETLKYLDAPLFTGEGMILSIILLSPLLVRALGDR